MNWIKLGAWLGAVTVVVGAFGAHALKGRLTAMGYGEQWKTAVLYQMVHVLALLLAGLCLKEAQQGNVFLRTAPWLFLSGIILFSGSLYALALTGQKGFGAVTPLGGLALIAGWVALALGGI